MRGIAVLAVAGLMLVASGTASAQQRMTGEVITASGTVEKIDGDMAKVGGGWRGIEMYEVVGLA